jgi:hypothetical protein
MAAAKCRKASIRPSKLVTLDLEFPSLPDVQSGVLRG